MTKLKSGKLLIYMAIVIVANSGYGGILSI
jgi:hypothetical protein